MRAPTRRGAEHVGEVAARTEAVLRAADLAGRLAHAGHGILVEQVVGVERQRPVILRDRRRKVVEIVRRQRLAAGAQPDAGEHVADVRVAVQQLERGAPDRRSPLKASAPPSSRPGESWLKLRVRIRPRPAQAQRIRQAGGTRELDAAAHGRTAVERDRLRAEGRLTRHLDIRPVHLEQRAAGAEPSIAPRAAQPQLVVGGRVRPDQCLILVDAAGLRRIVAGIHVGEQGDFLVGADPEVVTAADAVALGTGEIGVRPVVEAVADARFEQHAAVVGRKVGERRVVHGRVRELREAAGLDAVAEPAAARRHPPPLTQVARDFPEQRPLLHRLAPEAVVLDRLGRRAPPQDGRDARELRQAGSEFEARPAAVVVVEEDAAHPAPRPVAGRNEAGLPVGALLPRLLPRIGREGTELRRQVAGRDARVNRPDPCQCREIAWQQPRDAERLDQQVGLVALPLRRETRVADGGCQLRDGRRPGQLQAPQLVLAVVRFQIAVRGDVAAGVERPGVVDLPRADVLVLQVVGEQRRQLRGRLPQQREPRGNRLLRVGVGFPPKVGLHRAGVGQVRLGLGDARRAQQVVVIDEPGVGIAADRAAQRQLARDERQIERQAGVRAGRAAVRQREQVAAQLERAPLGVRAARQVAHRPRQRAGAVQRPLRSEQHLHPLDVVQPQVDRQRDVAEVGGDAVVVVVAGLLGAGQRIRVQAARDDDVAAARALVDHRQAGRPARQLRQVPDGPALDVGAGHRGDAQRHLPQRLLDASCRHDHGVVESREPQRDRGQLDEIARDRHALHRRRAEAAQEDGHGVDTGSDAGKRIPAARVRLHFARPVRSAARQEIFIRPRSAGKGTRAPSARAPGRRQRRRRRGSCGQYSEAAAGRYGCGRHVPPQQQDSNKAGSP